MHMRAPRRTCTTRIVARPIAGAFLAAAKFALDSSACCVSTHLDQFATSSRRSKQEVSSWDEPIALPHRARQGGIHRAMIWDRQALRSA